VILVGQGVLRSPGGYGISMNLLDLLLLTGKLMNPGCGLAPLAEENNDQGALEMGGLGDVLPGGTPIGHEESRKAISRAWGRSFPDSSGGSLTQFMERMQSGAIKALLIVGENPLGSLPPASGIQQALEGLQLLVCQELFLTDTAKKAHVILPACSSVERDGTFTSTEGHIQAVRKAVEPSGESRPDWEVFSALSVVMGDSMEYGDVKEIGKEIRNLLPGTRTLGPAPIPSKPSPTVVNHYVGGEYKRDVAIRYGLTEQEQTSGDTLLVSFTQSLFHSGKFSLKADGLLKIEHEGKLYLHPEEAARRGVGEGDQVILHNERGKVKTIVGFRERIPLGMAIFPEHFDQEMRQLASYEVDPETHVPYSKLTQVRIDKV